MMFSVLFESMRPLCSDVDITERTSQACLINKNMYHSLLSAVLQGNNTLIIVVYANCSNRALIYCGSYRFMSLTWR